MIRVTNVTKSFNENVAVRNLNLQIPRSKVVSLIGPSGCGKSTLIRMIIGIISPDAGHITINNEEMNQLSAVQLRQKMGYVIQQGGLFPHLTAKGNCALVAEYLGWDTHQINVRLKELCDLTGINFSDLEKYPSEFSGGQNQRIGLIRALMLDPEILLLDEPLGSIDPLIRYGLQNDLKEIFQSLNKTVLLVTHDLGEAGFLGDEIVLMNEGEIEQHGTLSDLIKNPGNEFVKRFVSAQRNHLTEAEG